MGSKRVRCTSVFQQASTSWFEADTKGYKANGKNIGLPVGTKHDSKANYSEHIVPYTSTRQAQNELISQPRRVVKSFSLATSPFKYNVIISERSTYQQTPVYYAVCSHFGPGMPDVSLHAGGDRNGSQVAVAYFRFSRHIRMGFGVEAINGGGKWEEIKNVSHLLGHGNYEFNYDVPGGMVEYVHDIDGSPGRTRKQFTWERTRDETDGVTSAVERHFGWRNYRLIEQDSGCVLAVMLVSMFTSVSYKGELNLHKDLSGEMEKVVVMSAICILEKGERRIGRYSFGKSP